LENNKKQRGVVSCGHQATANAAKQILEEGGNAYDALIAAYFVACTAEPVLASPGGGGYLIAHTANEKDIQYDFFTQTPKIKRPPNDLDFYPISADFGATQQEFHIGLGSIAVPGIVRGIFSICRDLCSMPIKHLMEAGIQAAREGIEVNALQGWLLDLVSPIFLATESSRLQFKSSFDDHRLIGEGEILKQPDLADIFEALMHDGDRIFYEGEIGKRIAQTVYEGGGHLSHSDFADYSIKKQKPLIFNYRKSKMLTNSPPASGGILVGFALKLLEKYDIKKHSFGTHEYLNLIANIMDITNIARRDADKGDGGKTNLENVLDREFLNIYKEQIHGRVKCSRGTTHINVIDRDGNIASLSVSNGEGCGHIIPGTGIMPNNMLGEEDLNPNGFHLWQTSHRMTSMMAPGIVICPDNHSIALGSGGSNRIRTAILQVLINLLEFEHSPEDAVNNPRIHYENECLDIEGGFDKREIKKLIEAFPNNNEWGIKNLYFGGVHTAQVKNGVFSGAGDPRRDGAAYIAY
jgi:gamma-glutamyltranspeptidase/glutathione hydrolase